MLVYKFISAKWGIDNLKNERIKVSNVDKLNDPFEFLSFDIRDGKIRKVMQAKKKVFSDAFGIISFSKSWISPLMWAHYADNHTGMVLGYEIDEKNLRRVKYIKKRILFDKNYASQALHNKHENWKYEREFRLMMELPSCVEEDGKYFQPEGDKVKLISIYLGTNFEGGKQCELHRKMIGRHIKINTVRAQFGDFDMCHQKSNNLMKNL